LEASLDANLLENDTYRENEGSPQLAAAAYVENVSAYREAERARRAAAVGEGAFASGAAASDGAGQPDDGTFEPADVQATPKDPNRDTGEYVEESDDEFEETAETLAAEAATEAAADVIDITYRDRIFLILQCISVLLHVVVAIWILTSPTDSGIFAQVRRNVDNLSVFEPSMNDPFLGWTQRVISAPLFSSASFLPFIALCHRLLLRNLSWHRLSFGTLLP